MPMAMSSVMVDLKKGAAMMRLPRMSMPDQGNLINALQNGPAVPASVAFTVRWGGAMKMMKKKIIRNAQHRFVAEIMETESAMEWTADVGEYRLEADPKTIKSVYALIGRERNGVFYR